MAQTVQDHDIVQYGYITHCKFSLSTETDHVMNTAWKDLTDSLNFKTQILRGTKRGFIFGKSCKMSRHEIWWQKGQYFAYYRPS